MKHYIIISILFFSCLKKEQPKPTVSITTKEITSIEWTTAISGGEISSDGGAVITLRGVVYSDSPNPTFESASKTEDDRGAGVFSSNLTKLKANTTYYVRAYAMNSNGIFYGNELSFKTSDWTPEKISNIFDWWTSDFGLAQTGDMLDSWKGRNGNVLMPYNSSHKAKVITNDQVWGGVNSILFNPTFTGSDCGYSMKANNNRTSKSIFLVCKITDLHGVDNILTTLGVFTASRFGIWGLNNSTYFCFRYIPPSPYYYAGNTFKANTYQFVRVTYDRTNGGVDFYADTTANFNKKIFTYPTGPSVDFTIGDYTISSYQGWYGLTPRMSVTEALYVDDVPSQADLNKYSNYLKAKYNLK